MWLEEIFELCIMQAQKSPEFGIQIYPKEERRMNVWKDGHFFGCLFCIGGSCIISWFGGAQGLLLTLCSGIASSVAQEQYVVLQIES